jgi:hypothetical protein
MANSSNLTFVYCEAYIRQPESERADAMNVSPFKSAVLRSERRRAAPKPPFYNTRRISLISAAGDLDLRTRQDGLPLLAPHKCGLWLSPDHIGRERPEGNQDSPGLFPPRPEAVV